ncbi:MAG: type III-A CRISPR-associated RAMP protein Csm3 [Promethearchaeota archaeon]
MSKDEIKKIELNRILYGKIILKGILEVITGLHIGTSNEDINIGTIDSLVIRDPITNQPIIPGSSLKGKLRTLAELSLKKKFNRSFDKGRIKRHECDKWEDAIECKVCRLFGSTGKDGHSNHPGRLIIRDLRLIDESIKELEKLDLDLYLTEVKFENSIDRITSAAVPRQFERVPAGSKFKLEIVYNVENNDQKNEDISNLKGFIELLEDDYLGGSGTRGYGKVKISITKEIEKNIEDYINIPNSNS